MGLSTESRTPVRVHLLPWPWQPVQQQQEQEQLQPAAELFKWTVAGEDLLYHYMQAIMAENVTSAPQIYTQILRNVFQQAGCGVEKEDLKKAFARAKKRLTPKPPKPAKAKAPPSAAVPASADAVTTGMQW